MSAAAAVATALIAFQSIFQSVQSHIPFLRRRVKATALLKAGIQDSSMQGKHRQAMPVRAGTQ
jgi:hypothetical protein